MSERCVRVDEALGAYVLGACPAPEADLVAGHIEHCRTCERVAARLGEGARLLLAGAPPVTPPPLVKERLMQRVRADATLFDAARSPEPAGAPRRPARALALACALLVALAMGLAGVQRAADGGDGTRVLAASVDPARAPGATATLELHDGRIRLEARGLPAPGRGRAYQVWVRRGRGAPRPAGAFLEPLGGGRREAVLSARDRDAGQVLVTSEPLGGSELPTRPPVLRVEL